MKWSLGLFLYGPMDAPAAEERLNRRAQRGWALERIWLQSLALFRKSHGKDLRYGVDLVEPRPAAEEAYLRRCAEAGWNPILQVGNLAVLSARPVARPAPLRSGRKMDPRTYWRLAVRPALWGSAVLLFLLLALTAAFALMSWKGVPARWSDLLCSTALFLAALGLLTALAGELYTLPAALGHWRRWKEGKAVRSRAAAARVRGALPRLSGLLMVLYVGFFLFETLLPLAGYSGHAVAAHRGALRERPLVMAEEVGLNPDTVTYLSWEPVWSLQVQGGRYVEQTAPEGGYQFVYCQRYTCLSEGYAARLCRALREESGAYNYEGYGLLDFQPVELGLDESWSARDGSFLLLRQGRTVALTGVHVMGGGAPDLTEPETLAVIADRLDLRE